MSRRGNPYDNAKAESFMKTVTRAAQMASYTLSICHLRRAHMAQQTLTA